MGSVCCPKTSVTINLRCVISQKSEDPIHICSLVWFIKIQPKYIVGRDDDDDEEEEEEEEEDDDDNDPDEDDFPMKTMFFKEETPGSSIDSFLL
jgi:CO dehydrogenase/acetyl-CoA synthase beta subunit